ncbi:ABC transporter substrate-binding protein [Desulfocurvibacter africanus]|uniref:Putative ABC transporter solute-binding protein n=1 Tax=Desulfocurvibacter africanus subsp. africanus str. Walvis Bay TaxID=690850 RepID=F3YTR3_DESAF|nr:ABC transporter substrate-binding protein [Desulfocurvibacter africanus]EGJ48444.1 putative ABC transporter solute-binding protein [Desulfocurvibacter africanus subsp. africanus str. Walvis Bay]
MNMRAALALPTLLSTMLIFILSLAACGNDEDAQVEQDKPLSQMAFEEIENQAQGTTVRFAMWGGWAHVNAWVDGFVAKQLAERHGIRLERISMDPPTYLNKLMGEKAAGREKGGIDLLWINGENFKSAMDAGLLWGPFADRLPNVRRYVDESTASQDFGFLTQGFEAPYGRAHFVFEHDEERTPNPPRSFAELREWVRANPGRFSYPQPPDFTGSAFLRQALYALTGGHEQYMAGFDQALFDVNAPKLWAYLNELKPYLWQEGRAYPKDSAALDTLFARGEVDLCMSYHPPHAQNKILEGTYPASTRSYVMSDGSLSNVHFTAIPFNAPNKAGAMVVADFLLSPEAQLSKFDPANWGDFPAVEASRLPQEWRERFAAVDLGQATLSPEALAAAAVPEIPPDWLAALETSWEREVLRQ